MNNCYFEKYQKSVNNPSLQKVNCISIELAPYTENVQFTFTDNTILRIEGDANFYNPSSGSSYGKSTNLSPVIVKNGSNGDVLRAESKYAITEFKIQEVANVREIKEYSSLVLDYCPAITEVNISKYNPNVYFDLNSFTKNNHVINKIRWHFNSLITGSIETMVANLIAGGKTGTLKLNLSGSSVTLNGNTFMTGVNENILITFTSSTNVTVQSKDDGTGPVIASWDGSTWTYA